MTYPITRFIDQSSNIYLQNLNLYDFDRVLVSIVYGNLYVDNSTFSSFSETVFLQTGINSNIQITSSQFDQNQKSVLFIDEGFTTIENTIFQDNHGVSADGCLKVFCFCFCFLVFFFCF